MTRLLLAGVATAIIDGLFATVQALINGSTVTRLWQNVASVLLGRSSFQGGTRTALIGVLMHIGVAFAWSAVFLILVTLSPSIRRLIDSPFGVLKVAVVYGPLIWMVMSLVVIPLILRRPPTITTRWWIQLVGHFPFVGIPIVASIGSGVPKVRPAGT